MALYAFDGTWNIRDGKDVLDSVQVTKYGKSRAASRATVETNIQRMAEFYRKGHVEYLQGVGTRFGAVGRLFGGAFGIGGRHRIRRMYRALATRYFAGDKCIDLIGFSRGAAQAIHFANVLSRHGIRNPDNPKHLAWWYYPALGWTFRHPKRGPNDVGEPTIHFLGVFDTVATFGWPVGPTRNTSRIWKVWTIPPNVDRAFHAMALDEIRKTFELVRPRMELPEGFTREQAAQRNDQLYEVWFRGAHANVGGGYLDRGLSDIALAWMMEQALWTWRRQRRPRLYGFREALRQIEPAPATTAAWIGTRREALTPNIDGAIGRTRKVPRKPAWRPVPENALFHHSVSRRTRNLVTDHYNLNRSLLRPLPGDARPVFDPPLQYDNTAEQLAAALVERVFSRVPVRPASWLRLNRRADGFVYRGDDWIAQGTSSGRTADPKKLATKGTSRSNFEKVAVSWFLGGGELEEQREALAASVDTTESGGLATGGEVVDWVIQVLTAAMPLIPRNPDVGFLVDRLDRSPDIG